MNRHFMKRVIVIEGSINAGAFHAKIQVNAETTFGDVKKMVSARLDGETVFFLNCQLKDDDVVVHVDRFEVSDLDPKAQEQFEKFYEDEREKWSSTPSDLLLNHRNTIK